MRLARIKGIPSVEYANSMHLNVMSNATATPTKAKVDTIGTQYMKCVVSLLISVIYSVMFDGSAPSGTTN